MGWKLTDALGRQKQLITNNANQAGLYSAIPAANVLPGGFYYATDRQATYFSDGTNWYLSSATPVFASTPPASPFDGQEWIFPVDATNGVDWRFRYNAGSASSYKWEFIGGAAVRTSSGQGNALSAGNNGFNALNPARGGDYELTATYTIQSSQNNVVFSYHNNGSVVQNGNTNLSYAVSFIMQTYKSQMTAVPAGAQIAFMIQANAGGGSMYSPVELFLLPRRIA